MKKKIDKITLSSVFFALGLILPFFTGQIREIGKMLLPMHIPVMLCGFICGQWYGLIVGFVLPVFRSVVFGMPILYPSAIAMSFELMTYGFFVGFIYKKCKCKNLISTYLSLIISMILGRIIWGVVSLILYGVIQKTFTLSFFIATTITNGFPGIILQIILIPIILKIIIRIKNRGGINEI